VACWCRQPSSKCPWSCGHRSLCDKCLINWKKTCTNQQTVFACPMCRATSSSSKSAVFKQCPKCGIWTEKIGGCDDVRCTFCKTRWNWATGQKREWDAFELWTYRILWVMMVLAYVHIIATSAIQLVSDPAAFCGNGLNMLVLFMSALLLVVLVRYELQDLV